jgi:hypothetical protein
LTTLIVGLVVGTLAGFFGRPLVTARPLNSAAIPAGAANPAITGLVAPSTTMDAVVAQTRHFKGDANASVTIIEFGDFRSRHFGSPLNTLFSAAACDRN